MAGRVAGKKAFITGAAQGLGAAAAHKLAAEGARVALADINLAGAEQVADAINLAHGKGVACALHLDVTQEDQWVEALARADAAMGGTTPTEFPIQLQTDFLKAQAGRVWVPLTMTLDPAKTAAGPLTLYLRVTPRGMASPAAAPAPEPAKDSKDKKKNDKDKDKNAKNAQIGRASCRERV